MRGCFHHLVFKIQCGKRYTMQSAAVTTAKGTAAARVQKYHGAASRRFKPSTVSLGGRSANRHTCQMTASQSFLWWWTVWGITDFYFCHCDCAERWFSRLCCAICVPVCVPVRELDCIYNFPQPNCTWNLCFTLTDKVHVLFFCKSTYIFAHSKNVSP